MTNKSLPVRGNISFEELKKLNEHGAEFWSARELQPLLGYSQWRRFEEAIKRGMISCGQSGNNPDYHFAGAGKMVELGSGSSRKVEDYLHDQIAIPDNHVTILRTDKLNPIFLSAYLNSIAGKYQVDKYFKGSSGQIELYPKDIDCFYVPLVDETIQMEIAALVQQSFTLKAESERLLDVAKRAVEIAIEQDEKVALDFIAARESNGAC